MGVLNLSDASIKSGGKRTTFWDQETTWNSGLELIASQSFTAITSVSFDNVFSDNYIQYKIVLQAENSAQANARTVQMRFRTSGVDFTGSNYHWQRILTYGTTNSGSRTTGVSAWNIALSGGTSYGARSTFIYEILNPFQTEYTNAVGTYHHFTSSTGSNSYLDAAGMNVTNSFDGCTFLCTDTITGTAAIYGYFKGA